MVFLYPIYKLSERIYEKMKASSGIDEMEGIHAAGDFLYRYNDLYDFLDGMMYMGSFALAIFVPIITGYFLYRLARYKVMANE